MPPYNFPIISSGKVSHAFLQRGAIDFNEAALLIRQMPYKRNADKENVMSVFIDGHGTCSTKHAVLKRLAEENEQKKIQLVLGIYHMNVTNTPSVRETLDAAGLIGLPEAHCYLKTPDGRLDVTWPHSRPDDFVEDLLSESVIKPHQITRYKVTHHQAFMKRWLKENPDVNYTMKQLWDIREQCIRDLEAAV